MNTDRRMDGEFVPCSENKVAREMVLSAGAGALSNVERFLQMGVSSDACYNRKYALCQAIASGHFEVAQLLLSHGANPNKGDENSGNHSLLLALERRRSDIVRLLIDESDLRLDLVNFTGTTALMMAAKAGDVNLVYHILRHLGSGLILNKDRFQESSISYAAASGHVNLVRLLFFMLSFRSNVIRAAVRNDVVEMKQLLGQGEDPNESELNRLTPLIVCAMLNSQQCLEVLLNETNINLEWFDVAGRNALHYASACGHGQAMQALMAKGCIASMTDGRGFNSLMLAASNGHLTCARLAIEKMKSEIDTARPTNELEVVRDNPFLSASSILSHQLNKEGRLLTDLNDCCSLDRSALMFAGQSGYLGIVRLLLDHGANVDTKAPTNGRTALMYASSNGHVDVVCELIERGASVHCDDAGGHTSLMFAALRGQVPCVRALMRAEAATEDKSKQSRSVLFNAIEKGQTEVVEFLFKELGVKRMVGYSDEFGRNGLLHSAVTGNIASLKLFVKAGLSLSKCRDSDGNTALMLASERGYINCMEYILRTHTVSVNELNARGWNALALAIFSNLPTAIIKCLINCGSDPNVTASYTDSTPLLHACLWGNEDYVRLLLKAGADVSRGNVFGYLPIEIAAERGEHIIVDQLLSIMKQKEGWACYPTIGEKHYFRAFATAVQRNHVDTVKLFLRLRLFSWDWYPHIVAMPGDNAWMFVKHLVMAGVSPATFPTPYGRLSPFLLSMAANHGRLTNYIVGNLYFTDSDILFVLRKFQLPEDIIIRKIECANDVTPIAVSRSSSDSRQDTAPRLGAIYPTQPVAENPTTRLAIGRELLHKPMPLTTMSYLKISSVVNRDVSLSEEERLNSLRSLPIPDVFIRKLAFSGPISKLCDEEWFGLDLMQPVLGMGSRWKTTLLKVTQLDSFPAFSGDFKRCQKKTCRCKGHGLTLRG